MYVSIQNKKWFIDIAKVKKNKVSGHFAICCLIQRATQTNFDLCLLSLSLFFQKFIAFASLSLTTLTHTLTLFTFACSTKLTLYTCFPHRSAPLPPPTLICEPKHDLSDQVFSPNSCTKCWRESKRPKLAYFSSPNFCLEMFWQVINMDWPEHEENYKHLE